MFQTNHSRTSMTPRPSEGGLGESAYSWSLRSPSASLWQGSFYCTCACTSDTDLLLERWDTYTRPSKYLGSFNATLNVLEANAPSGEGLSLSTPYSLSLRNHPYACRVEQRREAVSRLARRHRKPPRMPSTAFPGPDGPGPPEG